MKRRRKAGKIFLEMLFSVLISSDLRWGLFYLIFLFIFRNALLSLLVLISSDLRWGARTVSRFPARERRWRLDKPWKHSAETVWIRQSATLEKKKTFSHLFFIRRVVVNLRATSCERRKNIFISFYKKGCKPQSNQL